MEHLFFSSNNFNNLRNALDQYYNDNYSKKLTNNDNLKLKKIMQFVRSKVSDEVPTGYTPPQYNLLMNKKVMNLFTETIADDNNQHHLQVRNNPSTKYSSEVNSIFDQGAILDNSMPNNFLPPPEIQNQNKSQVPLFQQLETINEQRSDLNPQVENIDFSIKTDENDIDQNKMYQEMIQKRGISINNSPNMTSVNNNNAVQPDNGFVKNMSSFQSTNEIINQKLDSALEHMETTVKNDQYTNIADINENMTVQENFKVDKNSDMEGLPNNLDRNNIELVIEKSDDPKNMFYNEDRKVEQELHKLNTKSLSEHYETPVILPKQVKTYYDDFYITIDSRDRNLEIYPNPSEFQVKFSPASDSIEKQQVLDHHKNIIYEATTKILGNLSGASIRRIYTNIFEMKLLHCIVPFGLSWVCGKSPDNYYDGTCKGSATNSFCIPYGPIYDSSTGIAVSILNEPYLLLDIDEIQGPYEGTNDANTNAFAKLVLSSDWKRDHFFSQISSFVYMSTAGSETYKYKPTNLGTIDKMTLRLKRSDNQLYEFGNDKLYIKEICEGSPNKKTGTPNTKIIVQQNHDDYIDCHLDDLGIIPGELLYLYDTRPKEAHMIKFHKDVNLSCMDVLTKRQLNKYSLGLCSTKQSIKETTKICNLNTYNYKNRNKDFELINNSKQKYVRITADICKIENRTDIQSDLKEDNKNCNNIKEFKVDFNIFLQVGSYLAIVYKEVNTNKIYSELLKVYCINKYEVIAIKPKDYDETKDYEILRFGFAENYKRGISVPERNSLFSRSGHRACCVKKQCCDTSTDCKGSCYNPVNSEMVFELDYPYENLPDYIKAGHYFENEIFFIQQKLQISYTFKLTEVRKEDKDFESLLVKTA
jgi:hypothetical protein